MKSLSALVPLVLAEIPHSKERENIFLQKIPHRACVGVCGNSSVSETYFVSRVPTHTSTWNQGIDVEDFGVLNTKSLELGLFVVKENQDIIRVGYKVFFG